MSRRPAGSAAGTAAADPSPPVDLWSKLTASLPADRAPEAGRETTVLFMGNKGSGKTTLINLFKDGKSTEATIGLVYQHGKIRDVTSHIWELGGGTSLIDLVDVVLTPKTVLDALVCIVVNLEQPGDVLDTLLTCIDRVSKRANECLAEVAKRDAAAADARRKAAADQYGPEHPDLMVVRPCPVPLMVLANKYDTFREQESEYRKLMGRALRYVAHMFGASLYYVSQTDRADEKLASRFRSTVLHAILRDETGKRGSHTDLNKPLLIPAGTDQLDKIGAPPGTSRGSLEDWRRTIAKHFPPTPSAVDKAGALLDAKQFAEPAIDQLRAQKDEELERYRQQTERAGTMLAQIMNS